MRCYNCGAELGKGDNCQNCGTNVKVYKKILMASNAYYNDALEKAGVRDLSGAIESLKISLRFNKLNIDARNLLGLIYYEMGEVVTALTEWVISKNYQPKDNLASRYLDEVQKNQARLDSVNQTIKKYNQALLYCKQNSRDLAIIQLKKVLSLNPKLVSGHQLLALANGAATQKMKYGHRGANHPVKDLKTGKVYISTQSHGYVVKEETLDRDIAEPSFINVNDKTIEGVHYLGKNVQTVQFHPEACAGPLDTGFLFDEFMNMMEVSK